MPTPTVLQELSACIRKHYNLTRPVTLSELTAELVNLERKCKDGTLDDRQASLLASLTLIADKHGGPPTLH